MELQKLRYLRDHQAQLRTETYAGLMDLAGAEGIIADLQPHANVPNLPVEGGPQVVEQEVIPADSDLTRTGRRVFLGPVFVGSNRYMQAQYQQAMAILRAFGKPDLFVTETCNPKWPEITQNLLLRQRVPDRPDRPDLTVRVFQLKLKAILQDLSMGAHGIEMALIHVIEFQKRGLPHAHILIILAEEDKPQTPDHYDRFASAELPDPETCPLKHEAPCMKDGKCSKGYPKHFCDRTRSMDNGYPQYRQRNNGRTKYDCHINVEICNSISSVKYLYKYVYKGHDRLSVSIAENDEIQQYIDARYLSPTDSCWRIMRFELQAKTHTVVTLPVHLQNQQYVYFRESETVPAALNRGNHSMLTRFFQLAANDHFAKTLLYHDVPMYYRFGVPAASQRQPWHEPGTKQWIRRIRTTHKTVIGRMVSCGMQLIERYCLRLLLCYRKGPVRSKICASSMVLCTQHSSKLPSGKGCYTMIRNGIVPSGKRPASKCLHSCAKDHTCFPGMPQLLEFEHVESHVSNEDRAISNELLIAELAYPVSELEQTLATLGQLNDDQRIVYDRVTAAIVRYATEGVALATAASGIAALLLSGGRTIHSTFKLPLDLNQHTTCSIPIQSKRAELIRQAALIVWDKTSMSSRYALEAVNRTI
ncbi:uncharacterized protein LOC128297803 [Anopheles moucheti]|uniref:uncharacterized protein LOC128297803 n=1 Tax=Anopheles moucheti TaxID=186751 RepID=UPI0022F06A9D|nr:uncharacterized protein LOC128297803 [Anopheles moucheti]